MGLINDKKKNTTSIAKGKSRLKISMSKDGAEYTFFLDGRLDTVTSPHLESRINEVVGDAKKLILDLGKLEYITSAGLRVLLGTLEAMEDKGEMVVRDLTPTLQDVFKLTGFNKLFTIE